jgi:hypothetical protein
LSRVKIKIIRRGLVEQSDVLKNVLASKSSLFFLSEKKGAHGQSESSKVVVDITLIRSFNKHIHNASPFTTLHNKNITMKTTSILLSAAAVIAVLPSPVASFGISSSRTAAGVVSVR